MFKFVDSYRVVKAKNPLYLDGKIIANPSKDFLKSLGYKEVIIEEMPQQEGYSAESYYEETEEYIYLKWRLIENEESME